MFCRNQARPAAELCNSLPFCPNHRLAAAAQTSDCSWFFPSRWEILRVEWECSASSSNNRPAAAVSEHFLNHSRFISFTQCDFIICLMRQNYQIYILPTAAKNMSRAAKFKSRSTNFAARDLTLAAIGRNPRVGKGANEINFILSSFPFAESALAHARLLLLIFT